MINQYLNNSLIGKEIEIISMNGEPQYSGCKGVVKRVDSKGHLHGTWGGCSLIPELDLWKIIKQ